MNICILLIFAYSYLKKNSSYLDVWALLLVIGIFIFYDNRQKLAYILNYESKLTFEGIEKYIYDRDFKILFTEEEFRLFLNIAQMKKVKDTTLLAVEGEKIDKIIYLAMIPSYRSVMLRSRDTTISYLHEGAWLGVVEFFLHLNKSDLMHLSPGEDANANENVESIKWLTSLTLGKENMDVTYYEWDFVSLTNLFKYSNDNRFINKVLLVWIKYLTYSVVRLDDHVANAMKAMVHHDKKARDKTLPLSKDFK